ncbi:MAG: DNA topoisomerase IB [Dehalococcoidia bacterium]
MISAAEKTADNSVIAESVESAESAGLVYTSDDEPGIRRVRRGKGFSYYDPAENLVQDSRVLSRIKSLVIPPAWTDVWICMEPNGHLQATGRDAKGRKQYRYHNRWRETRDQDKYCGLPAFGESLPGIREKVELAMSQRGLPREKVIATVVALLDRGLIRVGNASYARENNSFGLTTMRDRHVEVSTTRVKFEFRGKRGIEQVVDISDRKLARVVKQCRDLPGYELFQYVDDDGQRRTVESADVNSYLREVTGLDFTAKDFRTWGGTVLALAALRRIGGFSTKREAQSNIVSAIDEVAAQLGNTRAICRKCYIHPQVIDAYMDGSLFDEAVTAALEGEHGYLEPEEAATLLLIGEDND